MPKPKKPSPSPKKPGAPETAAKNYDLVKPEADALDKARYATINMDIPQAVSMVLGVLPKITPLRADIVKDLPSHPIATLDKLETYALGVWYAHLLTLPAGSESSPVKALLEEAAPLREDLLSDAEALARRGLLNKDLVAEIRAGHGNIDIANDLVALGAAFTMNWSTISGKTAATLAEVERASVLGPLLLAALGVREQGSLQSSADPSATRAAMFTLFVNAYDETRRAVAYLRWHQGDADDIAPSFYKGRGGRPPSSPAEPQTGTSPDGSASGSTAAPTAGRAGGP